MQKKWSKNLAFYNMNQLDLMFVEDSVNDGHLIKRILKKESLTDKYTWLKDGEEALDYFAEKSNSIPKVVLLDVKMPKVNGFEVLEQLRKDDRTKDLPIVMYSSSVQESDIKKAYELGANSYLKKPETLNDMKSLFIQVFQYWVLYNKNISHE